MHRKRGFSLLELMIVLAIILILAAIASGPFHQQMMLAHEATAVEHVKTIHSVQAQYYAQFGRYAGTLTELGPPPNGADLLPKALADGKKSGYLFSIQSTATGYSVRAVPQSFNGTGRRNFFSDETGVIRENWAREPADINSPAI